MSERRGDEQRKITRRVKELGKYCDGDDLSLEGLKEKIAGIPPDVVLGVVLVSDVHFIHRACENERVTLEIVDCLLDAFPAIPSTDGDGWTPLHCACRNENMDPGIVRLLLERISAKWGKHLCVFFAKTEAQTRQRSWPFWTCCLMRLLFQRQPTTMGTCRFILPAIGANLSHFARGSSMPTPNR